MDKNTTQRLQEKNAKLINMVVERAKRDFPDDIAIIGLTGSFSTKDFYEKSDLDLIIINNTDDAWQIADCFIFDDVGYDIYCTSWENIEEKSILENPGVSTLTDLQILYSAKPEHLDRFNALRERAVNMLAEPIGEACIARAKTHIDKAKHDYADAMLSDEAGTVMYAAGRVLYNLVNALVNLNNTCIKRGIKRYLEELLCYEHLPKNFEKLYMALIEAKTVDEMRSAAGSFLKSTVELHDAMHQQFVKQPKPTYENLNGTYEELWCNCRNKVIVSTSVNDKSYAFFAALGAQNYLDEMTAMLGTKKFDLMRHFQADNLSLFKDTFLQAMNEYLLEYEKVGREVKRYDTFDELYNDFMRTKMES